MANNIELRKAYTTILDEVAVKESLTDVLTGSANLMKEGANAKEILIKKWDSDGLDDYSRNAFAFAEGDMETTWETKVCGFDRGKRFNADALDVQEAGDDFMDRAEYFIKQKVVPELDAYRISKYASAEGSTKATPAALTTGAQVVTALRAGCDAIEDTEMSLADCYLFISNKCKGLIDDMDTTKSRAVLSNFEGRIIKMPPTRFYTAIKQWSKTDGKSGYEKAADGKNLNFIIVPKEAVIQFQKRTALHIKSPENNDFDGWTFTYRTVGIADVYDNKAKGIYVHSDVE